MYLLWLAIFSHIYHINHLAQETYCETEAETYCETHMVLLPENQSFIVKIHAGMGMSDMGSAAFDLGKEIAGMTVPLVPKYNVI